jgi:Rhodopirellula transposase DDE domain
VPNAEAAVTELLADVTPLLDERQRRLTAAAGARALGRGGIAAVMRQTGMSRNTVKRGIRELEEGVELEAGRVRGAGAGRKRAIEQDPGLLEALAELVDQESRGDPESPLRWTCKSTRQLARALSARGHPTSHVRVGELLREQLGFRLQANAKVKEGKQHPDRDAQFRYINEQVRRHQRVGQPVVSIDAKKKELIGEYKAVGREWGPKGQPVKVQSHDFPDPKVPRAYPYGVYDVKANEGFVSVGRDRETAEFAAETLRRWWRKVGQVAYPEAKRLLICADAGGSNGYTRRLWKVELGRLAAGTGLSITVCHLPPGTSKWNKIEHRLFSAISMNWRGRPLTSYEVMVELIGSTTTSTGLKVHAEHDTGSYPKGIEVSDEELAAVPLKAHKFHGEWNYTVTPQ